LALALSVRRWCLCQHPAASKAKPAKAVLVALNRNGETVHHCVCFERTVLRTAREFKVKARSYKSHQASRRSAGLFDIEHFESAISGILCLGYPAPQPFREFRVTDAPVDFELSALHENIPAQ
jgi:hypothetical protein